MPQRNAFTDELREVLPASAPWEAWLAASGELAPDFSSLPSRPGLWPPQEGLRSRADWDGRRVELLARVEQWLTGPAPPRAAGATPPVVELVEERDDERDLLLHPEGGGSIRATVLLPEADRRPEGPLPVLAAGYAHAGWATRALRRGWAAVLFAGGDGLDDSGSLPGPSDWSVLGRRAAAASVALDAIAALPELDATRVVVAGHGHDGKAAILAGAFDPRFAGVVSSSSGLLGAMAARLCSDRQFGEGTEALTRSLPGWFHPRLRFFAGREDRLPTDAHEVIALVAPRPVLLGVAVHDPTESVTAAEELKRTLDDLGRFLGVPAPTTTLLLREGDHDVGPDAVERYLDWCEVTVGQPGGGTFTTDQVGGAGPRGSSAGKAVPPGARILRTHTRAGLAVDVYAPLGLPADEVTPVVLWCPPSSPATGYVAGYEHATPIHALLARAGIVVVCWDPPGTGARVHEPIRRADDEAPAVLDAALRLEELSAGPIFTLGYAAGAETALRVAAAHGRVTGVAAVAPDALALGSLLRAARGKDVLVVAPRWSTKADPGALRRAAAEAEGGPARLDVAEPADFRFGAPARAAVLAWVTRAVARRTAAGR